MNAFTYLHYALELHSPVIVSTLPVVPHKAETQAFIPGSALRGSIAARLVAKGDSGESSEFGALILSGMVRYFHAYPAIQGARALPVPTSWKCDKNTTTEAIDVGCFSGLISPEDDADFHDVWPEDASSIPGRPFVAATVSGFSRLIVAPRRDARLHQQRDREKGRPWKDREERQHGAIFAYEYLEAEQVFHGVIQVREDEEALSRRAYIKALFADKLLLGRSRRAGYGGEASVTFSNESSREWEDVSSVGVLQGDIQAGQHFRIMLTSAYIGRHPETGQIDPTAFEHELRDLLGGAATVERRRWTFETIGGFNQKWRLELPQAQAAAAGAIFVLKASEAIPNDVIQRIEHEGLGERRVEGFGRVLFLTHDDERNCLRLDFSQRETEKAEISAMDACAKQQIERVEKRMMLIAARAELNRIAVLDIAGKVKMEEIPTKSLLAGLRAIFRNVHDEATALDAFSNLRGKCDSAAREKLERCKVVFGHDLRLWLLLFGEMNDAWKPWHALLKASGGALTGLAERCRLTETIAAQEILHAHAAELGVYLIDAVLASLVKRASGNAR